MAKDKARSSKYRLSWASLILSLAFYIWWFLWPLLSLTARLGTPLLHLYLGLPLWFWLSSILSLFLLFAACQIFLPETDDAEPSENKRGEGLAQ